MFGGNNSNCLGAQGNSSLDGAMSMHEFTGKLYGGVAWGNVEISVVR
jgi:hypothetical protein